MPPAPPRFAAQGPYMIRPSLAGRSILIVEDEPLIALDIAAEFEKVGAQVVQTATLKEALHLIEADGLSAAILEYCKRSALKV